MMKKTFLEQITEDKIENMTYLVRPVTDKERKIVETVTRTLVREFERDKENYEAQIEKMKCCGNCNKACNLKESDTCIGKGLNEWELKDN